MFSLQIAVEVVSRTLTNGLEHELAHDSTRDASEEGVRVLVLENALGHRNNGWTNTLGRRGDLDTHLDDIEGVRLVREDRRGKHESKYHCRTYAAADGGNEVVGDVGSAVRLVGLIIICVVVHPSEGKSEKK